MEKRKRSIFGLADITVRLLLKSVTVQLNCLCVGDSEPLCLWLRNRVPKLPDPTVLLNKNDQVKGRQKKNFDADHGVKMLPTVWILDRHTMGRVVKEIAPRSFVVETQEGNFRRNRRGLVLMPKDQDERGGDMSEEEETADEQGRRRVEDE